MVHIIIKNGVNMSDFLDVLEVLGYALLVVLGIIAGVLFIGYNLDKYACETKGEIYDIDTDYNFTGCYAVLPDGKMLMRHYEEQTQRTLNVNMVK